MFLIASKLKKITWQKWLICAAFLSYFFVGMGIYKNYGISWDEPFSREHGQVSFNYVAKIFGYTVQGEFYDNPLDLHNYGDRDHGVGFELPLAAVEYFLGVEGYKEIFQMRHALTFCLSFLGAVTIFYIGRRRFESRWIALIAVGVYVFSPRLFAEAFYNSKDMGFMVVFTIGIWSLYRLMEAPTLTNALVHGFFTSAAVDIRIQGVVMVLATLGMLIAMAFKKDISWRKSRLAIFVYLLASVSFTISMWPLLWDQPLKNFLEVMMNSTRYRWPGSLLYFGQIIKASQLPWHYLPVYIGLTIPLAHLLMAALGFVAILGLMWRHSTLWVDSKSRFDFAVLMFFLAPIMGIVFLNSVVYDGWRHMYFVFGPLVLLSVRGFAFLVDAMRSSSFWKFGVTSLGAILIVPNAIWILKNHPMENVYFNHLAPKPWVSNFDVDYWGLANRRALRAIFKDEQGGAIAVKVLSATPLEDSLIFFGPGDRARLKFVQDVSTATHLMSNFRSQSEISPEVTDEILAAHWTVMHQEIVGGEVISVVYKRRPI